MQVCVEAGSGSAPKHTHTNIHRRSLMKTSFSFAPALCPPRCAPRAVSCRALCTWLAR